LGSSATITSVRRTLVPTAGWMDGWMNGRTDGWKDGLLCSRYVGSYWGSYGGLKNISGEDSYFVLFGKHYLADQTEDSVKSGAYSTHGEIRISYIFWSRNVKMPRQIPRPSS
jgi:hypothetical protein